MSNAYGQERILDTMHAEGAKVDEEKAGADLTDPDARLLRLFNHYRHDWMNDIQLLMAYVQLKKYDKLPPLMEKIKEKVRQEGYVSKLGIPSLIVYLLSFQSEVKELELEISMNEEIRLPELQNPSAAAASLVRALESFKDEARSFADGQGLLDLHLSRDSEAAHLAITIQYEGPYAEERMKSRESSLNADLDSTGSAAVKGTYCEGKVVWASAWRYSE
ncbi:Spo0B domain-containing protein [Paenibacillus sp. S-38]|uniref:Spo0B domain-containing protein n=1 Tax=Paenibacillus sp. S-38 TaxID=3416710 RepID=UPI003CE6C355